MHCNSPIREVIENDEPPVYVNRSSCFQLCHKAKNIAVQPLPVGALK